MATLRKTLKRIEHPGHVRYITCSCYRRLALFSNDKIKQVFVDQLCLTRDRLGFELYGWVVMPEHIHLLLMPDPPRLTVTQILSALKRPVARDVLQRWREIEASVLTRLSDARGKPHFWQRGGGYDRNLVSDHEVYEKIEYVHDNPRRRRLVASPADWPWSSARWYAGHPDALIEMDALPV